MEINSIFFTALQLGPYLFNLDSGTYVPQNVGVLCVTDGATCEWSDGLMDSFFISDFQSHILIPTWCLWCFSDRWLVFFHYISICFPKRMVLSYFLYRVSSSFTPVHFFGLGIALANMLRLGFCESFSLAVFVGLG